LVKLILRDKEYEVKPGMTLLSALQKINIVPESVIATRDGEMILEDEILKDGDMVKLIAVISGGSYHCEGGALPKGPEATPALAPGASVSSLNRELLRCGERSSQ
jgi:sulfur carrier protein ThiS